MWKWLAGVILFFGAVAFATWYVGSIKNCMEKAGHYERSCT